MQCLSFVFFLQSHYELNLDIQHNFTALPRIASRAQDLQTQQVRQPPGLWVLYIGLSLTKSIYEFSNLFVFFSLSFPISLCLSLSLLLTPPLSLFPSISLSLLPSVFLSLSLSSWTPLYCCSTLACSPLGSTLTGCGRFNRTGPWMSPERLQSRSIWRELASCFRNRWEPRPKQTKGRGECLDI